MASVQLVQGRTLGTGCAMSAGGMPLSTLLEPRPEVRFWTCEVFDRLLINRALAVASSREPQCHVRRDPPLVLAVAWVSIALVLDRHLSRSCIRPDVMGRVVCFEAPSLPWEKYVDLSCPFLS